MCNLSLFTGASQYRSGFEKAFTLLKASASEEPDKTKKRIILFLTDGDPSDDNRTLIFKTIRDRNSELNNSVIIFTFGIDPDSAEILKDIAEQNTEKHGFPRNGDITVKFILSSRETANICAGMKFGREGYFSENSTLLKTKIFHFLPRVSQNSAFCNYFLQIVKGQSCIGSFIICPGSSVILTDC